MKSRSSLIGITGLLAGALAVLIVAGVTVWGAMSAWQERTLRHSAPTAPVEAAPERATTPAALESGVQPGEVRPAYPNMIARPMFMSTRRVPEEAPPPEEPEIEEEPPPDPDPVQARLRSVIITADDRFAWLQPRDEEHQIRLAVGDKLDGWTLTAIERTHVQFNFNDTSMRLPLRSMRSVGDPSEPVRPRPRARD